MTISFKSSLRRSKNYLNLRLQNPNRLLDFMFSAKDPFNPSALYEQIQTEHIAAAIQYRSPDRQWWG